MAPPTTAELCAQLEALTAQMEAMKAEITALQSGTPAPPTTRPLIVLLKEPHVAAPETFSGKEDLRIYLQQCELCFELQPSRYPTDYQKVGLILSYLRGPAAKWARPYLLSKDHELRKSLPEFVKAIDQAYGDPDYELRAASELRALRQTGSVAKYAAEFQAIASNLSWNESALCSQFYEGLKDTVKDEIAKDPPGTLRPLVTAATRVDNRQHERRNEVKKPTASIPATEKPHRSKPPTYSQSPIDDSRPPDTTERARRKANGLCYYCGDPDHTQSDCPKLAQKNATATTITLGPIDYPPLSVQGNYLPQTDSRRD